MRNPRRLVAILAISLVVPASAAVLAAAPAQAAVGDLVVNEAGPNGTDFIEIYNTGSTTVDAGGLYLMDDQTRKPDDPCRDDDRPRRVSSRRPRRSVWAVPTPPVSWGPTKQLSSAATAGPLLPPGAGVAARTAPAPSSIRQLRRRVSRTRALAARSRIRRSSSMRSARRVPTSWSSSTPQPSRPTSSGIVVKDNDNTHSQVIPANTTIPGNGYLSIDVTAFGLGDADSARIFDRDGTTLIDSYSWFAGANNSYARCPDVTGAFAPTTAVTKDAGNGSSCFNVASTPWPGSPTVSLADQTAAFGADVSGLAYDGTGTTNRGVLWAVQNTTGQALPAAVERLSLDARRRQRMERWQAAVLQSRGWAARQ